MPKGKRVGTWMLVLILVLYAAGCGVQDPAGTESQTGASNPSETLGSQDRPTETTVPKATELSTQPSTVPPTTEPAVEPTTVPVTQPSTTPSVPEPSTHPSETEPSSQPSTSPPETQPPTEETTDPPITQPPITVPPATEPVHSGGIPNQVTVEASGVLEKRNDKAVIDYSNTKDGYVMVCCTAATDKKLKAQVQGPSTTYTYDLTPGKWAAFPLSDENGTYKITVYQNTGGSKYAAVLSLSVEVVMEDEFAPFLRSNQYVDFDAASRTVAKAAELTAGITDPLKKVEKVYDFVVQNLTYDKELASTVKSGYLPDLDKVLEKRKGICFDYAALMTGMLRSQGVPAKLVVGYAGEVYHAWISVWSETDGWIDGVIWFDGATWQRMDPTFASSGGSSPDILDYIGTGSNYTPKYFY